MEAAGVGLSALALFVECLKAYKLFSAAHYLSSDLKILKTKFQIEETRLTQWGFYWGYQPSPTECGLDASIEAAGQNVASTVKLTLREISTLLKKYTALSEKYDGDRSGGGGRAYLGMVWALKDRAALESTIQDLTDFNNGLHQLLPKKSEASLAQVVACSLTRDNDGDDLDNIIAAAASLRYTDASKLAGFKRAYQMLVLAEEQQQQSSHPPVLPTTLQLDAGMFDLSDVYSSTERTFAKFKKSKKMIIEWKAYHPSMLSGSQTAKITLRHRVSHFAELMSDRTERLEGFNVLTCRGYFDQALSERFGFAYDFPPHVLHHMPFTLLELITGSSIPPLGMRFKLATSLSRTLNMLHTSGWLHKSIRSNNVAIFQSTETSAPEFERPYLVGFGFSRPDGYGEETFGEQSAAASANQLYRHPEVQGQDPRRCTASDDFYSLGLVLLEIALWMPLADIQGRGGTTSSEVLLDMAKIKAAVSGLPRRVGTIYQEVVQGCLNFGGAKEQSMLAQSAAAWAAERLRNQNRFYWDVVKKLEGCRA